LNALLAIPLPDGRWIGLTPEAFASALEAGSALGLGPATTSIAAGPPEPLLNSEQMAALVGVHSTTIEAMAKRDEIPSVRIGKALRFEPSAVKAKLRNRRKEK